MDLEKKNGARPDVDIAALRHATTKGNTPRFWRSLEELADTPEFRDHAENEFPHGANDPGATLVAPSFPPKKSSLTSASRSRSSPASRCFTRRP